VICGGGDVIVAAETGSGKTHAYLAPIFELTLRHRKEAESREKDTTDEPIRIPHRFSLVLCPNATLCQQVVDMASMLQSEQGETLLDVKAICGGQVISCCFLAVCKDWTNTAVVTLFHDVCLFLLFSYSCSV
jgi:superfamily II DNA/RNA helicase